MIRGILKGDYNETHPLKKLYNFDGKFYFDEEEKNCSSVEKKSNSLQSKS